jgi:hypothetical protein
MVRMFREYNLNAAERLLQATRRQIDRRAIDLRIGVHQFRSVHMLAGGRDQATPLLRVLDKRAQGWLPR